MIATFQHLLALVVIDALLALVAFVWVAQSTLAEAQRKAARKQRKQNRDK